VALSRRSRKGWTWHPAAKSESKRFQEKDPGAHALMVAKLEHMTEVGGGGRLGQAARGRIRQLPVVIGSSCWVVLFVERRDGGGLGGLLIHQCQGLAKDPPEEAYELGRHRLSAMSGW
jgi:hypothetical protein